MRVGPVEPLQFFEQLQSCKCTDSQQARLRHNGRPEGLGPVAMAGLHDVGIEEAVAAPGARMTVAVSAQLVAHERPYPACSSVARCRGADEPPGMVSMRQARGRSPRVRRGAAIGGRGEAESELPHRNAALTR